MNLQNLRDTAWNGLWKQNTGLVQLLGRGTDGRLCADNPVLDFGTVDQKHDVTAAKPRLSCR